MDRKTLQLHVTALQVLVVGMYAALLKRDPDLVREVVMDEGLTNVASMPGLAGYSARDKQALQGILDTILRPIRAALGKGPSIQ